LSDAPGITDKEFTMISLVSGDLLQAHTEAIVNTVNTVGVMGKGIALQVKRAFPQVNALYERAAKKGEVVPGHVLVVPTNRLENPRFIINFPTKRHWRARSRIDDIEAGLRDLVRAVREYGIKSIAIPPLGCGSGGLDWDDVRPRILAALEPLHDVEIRVYAPDGAPEPEAQQVGTKRPSLTPLRAGLIQLIEQYAMPGYRLGLLEVQKLAYFWERAGSATGLDFVKQQYGPYSEKLNFVLQALEGHFIRGYGDRTGRASIYPLPGAMQESDNLLASDPDARDRVERVLRLIEGFETPYGMELLATVHWVTSHDALARRRVADCIVRVHAWSERKRRLLRPEHIEAAWRRLRSQDWLRATPVPVVGEPAIAL
jgi:O-acetyl-ADP-ribose deacetylase (regulator of RNase III)